MIQINIYQLPVFSIDVLAQMKTPASLTRVGHIELDTFDRDECWRLGNWTAWTDEKPSNLHYEGRSFSSDVVFNNPQDSTYHLALPMGWHVENSLEDMIKFIENYKFV